MEMKFTYSSFATYEVMNINKNAFAFKKTIDRVVTSNSFLGETKTSDSHKKDSSKENEKVTKDVGKSENFTIDDRGYVIAQETAQKIDDPFLAMMVEGIHRSTDLFNPFFIGKEFKIGASIPFIDSFSKESQGTSFSFTRDKMQMLDSGAFTVNDIQNGMASISYKGIVSTNMVSASKENPMMLASKDTRFSEIILDLSTGIVMSQASGSEGISKTNDISNTVVSGTSSSGTMKTRYTTSIKITLLK